MEMIVGWLWGVWWGCGGGGGCLEGSAAALLNKAWSLLTDVKTRSCQFPAQFMKRKCSRWKDYEGVDALSRGLECERSEPTEHRSLKRRTLNLRTGKCQFDRIRSSRRVFEPALVLALGSHILYILHGEVTSKRKGNGKRRRSSESTHYFLKAFLAPFVTWSWTALSRLPRLLWYNRN